MQFKLEKFWSNISAKAFAASALATLILLGAFSKPGLATITVTAVSKVDLSTLGNFQNDTYFYPYIYTTAEQSFGSFPTATPTPIPSFGVLGPGVTFVDLGEDPNPSAITAAGGPPTDPGIIYFNISSTNTSFPSQPVIVVTTSVTSNAAPYYLVPIASVNGSYCNGTSCQLGPGQGGANTGGFGQYYFGALYNQGQVMTIGISPNALCKSVNQIGGNYLALGCGSFPFTGQLSTATATTDMSINFEIFAQQDLINAIGTTPLAPPSTTPQDGPTSVPLEFESIGPVAVPTPNPSPTPEEVCAFADGMESAQQGGIQLDTSSTYFTINGDPAGSDPTQIIVIAVPSPGPILQTLAGNYTQNQSVPGGLATPIPAATQPPVVGNFTNSTDPGNPFYYTIGFLAEDAAGFVFDPGPNAIGSCVFPFSFDTSNVQGFLQSSKCFIATAAFRSMDAAPLVLLRSFRDNFLEHFSLGQSFVHWYYGWSPDAAEWLIDHPIFRFPVLLALIPLQIFAWIVLHPILLLLLIVSSLGVFGFSLLGQSAAKIGRSAE